MNERYVTEEICGERHKNADERFGRDRERLDRQEEKMEKVSDLSIQMGEILKNHEAKLDDHDQRIGALESKPGQLWDRLMFALIGALATGVVGILLERGLM